MADIEELARSAKAVFDAHAKAVAEEADRAARAARAAVVDAHSLETARLREARDAAAQALREHIDATAAHPWEGKRVRRITHHKDWRGVALQDRPPKSVELGVVEIRRAATVMPGNLGYSLPRQGEAFVRLLKKNGAPGTAISALDDWRRGKWALVEDAQAIEAATAGET